MLISASCCIRREDAGIEIPAGLVTLLFSDKVCALEAHVIQNQEEILPTHVTLWMAVGIRGKEPNFIPETLKSSHASRVDFMPIELTQVVELSSYLDPVHIMQTLARVCLHVCRCRGKISFCSTELAFSI
ncbi:hypothetical protein KP509_28G039200 [Ceratopteris richardii]|uniref:Uncharacterized protein n=1 Tax=Ceratopteris richardii TaxID=49495 RepID=A0A8T2RDV8_CERRI|nr:hypothetical protein KP509_28G039200 [Ceratopteris richardii]